MKAFVNSLLAITSSILILELFFYFQILNEQTDAAQLNLFAVNYAGYYFDDIVQDIKVLSKNNLTLNRINNTTISISFTNSPSAYDLQSVLSNYTEKLNSTAQEKLNVNLTINTSNISSNNLTYFFSNNVIYSVSYSAPYEIFLISSAEADFQNYTIKYNTNLTRQSLTTFNYTTTGGVYMKMNYTDGNGTHISEGYLNSSQINVFNVNFTNTTGFEVHIKNINGNADALQIVRNVQNSTLYVHTIMKNNGTYSVYAFLPIYVNITHFTYSKNTRLTMVEG